MIIIDGTKLKPEPSNHRTATEGPALNYKVFKHISLENMMYSCVKLSFLGFGGPSFVSNPPASKPSRHYKGGSLNEDEAQ